MAFILCILGIILGMYIIVIHIACSYMIYDVFKSEFHRNCFLCFIPVVNMFIIVYLSDKHQIGKSSR